MIVLILGPSGCGKGTQAELISKKYGLVHVSTGDLLRKAYEEKLPLGLKAFEWWGKGQWAPSEIVGQLLLQELKKYPEGHFVLEGWPRLSEQKEILSAYLSERNLKIDMVFYLDTPREISIERIKGRVRRSIETGGVPRVDDRDEIINERLNSYYKTINPILDYYKGLGLLQVVDNRPSIEDVFKDISKRLDDYLQNK